MPLKSGLRKVGAIRRCSSGTHILNEGEGMGEELRFLWNATRGNRLRPWRSPYLRWRLETYSGQKADTVRARDFWNLFWKEKRQLLRFLRWTREMKEFSDSGTTL